MDYAFEIKPAKGSQKTFRKYNINNKDYIGVHGDEPYVLNFRNNAHRAVEVRFSIDGTDILTGRPADLSLGATKRWVVQGYSACELEAWPESEKSGGRFVFAHAGQTVAAHTHGDVSHMGVIAAAVFVETAPPQEFKTGGFLGDMLRGGSYSYGGGTKGGGLQTMGLDLHATRSAGPGTGVGSRVEQRIGHAQGLVQPKLACVMHVHYVWWDDLQAMLRETAPKVSVVPGFPAASVADFTGINLSGVPRIETDDPRFTG